MHHLPVIKNIVFDFGGVILNIDHRRLEKAFDQLGIKDFEQLFNQASQSDVFREFEKGQLSASEFRNEIRRFVGLSLPDETIDHTWNEIIMDYPPERIQLLKKIRKNYRIFILSNTNQIHYNHYIPKFREEFGFDFESLFDNVYWSFKTGMRKPDPDPFLFLMRNENIRPEMTVFIDDTMQNTEVARQLGFQVLHLQKGVEITNLFNEATFSALRLPDW
jgi:glucose-1-phosphatase